MDRRVLALRFWLLCIVVALAMFACPGFAATCAAGASFTTLGFLLRCCCGGLACTACDSNGGPAQMQVVVSGVANEVCSGCNSYNGTWVLDPSPFNSQGLLSDPLCTYLYRDDDATVCSASDGIFIDYQNRESGGIYFNAAGGDTQVGGTAEVGGSEIHASIPNCMSFNNFSLTPVVTDAADSCDNNSSTWLVTSL